MQRTMKKVMERLLEIQEKRRQYKSKASSRVIEFRKDKFSHEHFVKFKDDPDKTIKKAVLESLEACRGILEENDCDAEIERWKIRNCPKDWREDTKLKDILVEDVISLVYAARLDK